MARTKRIDDAAFGAIYGSITVLGILAATDPETLNAFVTAGTLFTSLLAVSLAKAYADLASMVLETARQASIEMVRTAWAHGRTTLIAVNLPTLSMLLGALGIYSDEIALWLAQFFAIALLVYYGARIGYRLLGTVFSTCVGGAFTGAIGLALSLLKNVFH